MKLENAVCCEDAVYQNSEVYCPKCNNEIPYSHLLKLDTFQVIQIQCGKCLEYLAVSYQDDKHNSFNITKWF